MATIQMNFKKQLLHHSIFVNFVDIRDNAFLLSGSTVRTMNTLRLKVASEEIMDIAQGYFLFWYFVAYLSSYHEKAINALYELA